MLQLLLQEQKELYAEDSQDLLDSTNIYPDFFKKVITGHESYFMAITAKQRAKPNLPNVEENHEQKSRKQHVFTKKSLTD